MRPLLLLLWLLALSITPSSARADQGVASTPQGQPTTERFFGAVQAIFNPQRAAEAGVQWQRLIFPWSMIQKDGPNSWSDGYFTDQQIAHEVDSRHPARRDRALHAAMGEQHAQRPNPDERSRNLYLPFDDPQNYWGQFMFKLALRYRGQIDTWIVWNEPDMYNDAFAYTWDGSVSDLYQLVKVASQAVKKANPNAKSGAAGDDLLVGQGRRPPAVPGALSRGRREGSDRGGERLLLRRRHPAPSRTR